MGLLLVEAVGMIAPPVGLIYLGVVIGAEDYPPEIEWEFVLWTVMALTAMTAVITGIAVHRRLNGVSLDQSLLVMELLTGAGAGGLLGAIVGMSRASADRERNTVESQRDAFLFLNRLLRHHVLNSITVIDGFAERTRPHATGAGSEYLDTIRDHADNVTGLVQNVDAVVKTYTGNPPRQRIELTPMLQTEIAQVRESYPEVTIHTDLETATVDGNELLAIAFRNLLENAVKHNDAENPRIDISIDARPETATVRIRDNGPGIPDEERSKIFETGDRGDRGIGLYLANRLVRKLGGELTLGDESDSGTTIEVELPNPAGSDETGRGQGWPQAPPIGQVD